MAEPDNLVLDLLRVMRGDMAKMADAMRSLSVEMTAIRQHLADVVTIQDMTTGKSRPSSTAWIVSSDALN